MNIFIANDKMNKYLADELTECLSSVGHVVTSIENISKGNNLYTEMGKNIAIADAIIVIASASNSDKSTETVSLHKIEEIRTLLSSIRSQNVPLLIPIILGKITTMPRELRNSDYLVIPFDDDKNRQDEFHDAESLQLNKIRKEEIIERIILMIAARAETVNKYRQSKIEIAEKVQSGLSKYIDGVFKVLQKNERTNKTVSYVLYSVTALILVFPCIALIYLFKSIDVQALSLQIAVIYAITSLFVLMIIVSIAKLFFTLAKAFMVESIRCSDRFHAISFGKFFLDAYGSDATREEVIMAFSTWNIDNGGTAFKNQSSEDIDPKLTEMIGLLKQK